MIICSCNVISDHDVREVAASQPAPVRMSQLYRDLGCKPQCGRCRRAVKHAAGASHECDRRPRGGLPDRSASTRRMTGH
jgi:bacterioferritin-associated ferredoxin